MVTVPPAGIVKRPVGSLNVNAEFEIPAASVMRSPPLKRYTFEMVESDETPMRLKPRLVTATATPVGFEKVYADRLTLDERR